MNIRTVVHTMQNMYCYYCSVLNYTVKYSTSIDTGAGSTRNTFILCECTVLYILALIGESRCFTQRVLCRAAVRGNAQRCGVDRCSCPPNSRHPSCERAPNLHRELYCRGWAAMRREQWCWSTGLWHDAGSDAAEQLQWHHNAHKYSNRKIYSSLYSRENGGLN